MPDKSSSKPIAIWRRGALETAAAIRAGEFTCREVVRAHLHRIDSVNDRVNALSVILRDEALAEAEAADQALSRGGRVGPLHGVPISVKENIDVTGSATTQGVPALVDAVPEVDAPHLAHLRSAGAIVIGRGNMPDLGLRLHTDSSLRGPTRNPWDPKRTPGGSSGGDAVAVATGMVPLALGNDLGGSLRWPAVVNGVCALRPTLGRVADASVLPGPPPPLSFQLFAVQGPIARRVADLRLALEIMGRNSPRDPWHTPMPQHGSLAGSSLRVGLVRNPDGVAVDRHVAAGLDAAVDALTDLGWRVEEVEPPEVGRCAEVWRELLVSDLRNLVRPQLDGALGVDAEAFLDLVQDSVPERSPAELGVLWQERHRLARAWRAFHARWPVLLGPVATREPFAPGADLQSAQSVAAIFEALRLTHAVNLLGLPAVALPVGRSRGGLPRGVQLISDRYREDLALEVAAALEARLGILTPTDPA